MNIAIEARDIIKKIGHIFSDTGEEDLKECRMCVVLLSNNNAAYYLTMATHNNTVLETYLKHKDANYLLKKDKCDGLKKTSLVNLKTIYRGPLEGQCVAIVPTNEFQKLISKFKEYQSENPDDFFDEIRNVL